MNNIAADLNKKYIETMDAALEDSVLGRLRDLWWKHYLQSIKEEGIDKALDALDKFMRIGNEEFRIRADKYAVSKGHELNTARYIQSVNQFLKSNTGKMFERFVGISLAQALFVSESKYCVVPFNDTFLKYCRGLSVKDFQVKVLLGGKWLITHIDTDLVAFNPSDESSEIYMISVKSTLKDRFHNVPFWNLLRQSSISSDFKHIKADNKALLSKVRYIAICSDLAEQQPDFGAEAGPRNLLCIDAALLDGAYVSASKARGLGNDSGETIGHERRAAFYPLSRFFSLLS